MRTKVNDQLFSAITSQLDEVLGLPTLPSKLHDDLEWFAFEFCQRAIFEHYHSQFRHKGKLVDASYAVGVYIRFFCENITEVEEKFSKGCELLEYYDFWSDRWTGGNVKMSEQAKQRVLSVAEISDETSIKDLITIVVAVFLYGGRVTLRAAS